jgi:hypothetical protein
MIKLDEMGRACSTLGKCNGKGKLVPVCKYHTMKVVMEVSGRLHALAILPPRERAPGTQWRGGWVNPRAALNVAAKRKNPAPGSN